MGCGVGHRPAAVAPIRPLAWEPPCAMGVALEKAEKTTTKKNLKHMYVNREIILEVTQRYVKTGYEVLPQKHLALCKTVIAPDSPSDL